MGNYLNADQITFLRRYGNAVDMKIWKDSNGDIRTILTTALGVNSFSTSTLDPDVSHTTLSELGDIYTEYETEVKKAPWFSHNFLEEAEIPAFSKVFYAYVCMMGKIPTPEEFYTSYMDLYCTINGNLFEFLPEYEPVVGERGKPLPPKEPLYLSYMQRRIVRCYPSFIREIYALFYLLLNSNDTGITFLYSHYADIHKDTDIVAENAEHTFYSICLYNKSNSSFIRRNEKENRVTSAKKKEFSAEIKICATKPDENIRNTITVHGLHIYSPNVLDTAINIIKENKFGIYQL